MSLPIKSCVCPCYRAMSTIVDIDINIFELSLASSQSTTFVSIFPIASQSLYRLNHSNMSSQSKAQASAAAAAEALFFEELDAATIVNMQCAKYYAAGVVGLIALFTITHWSQIIFTNTVSRSNPIARAATFVSTPFRRLLKGWAAGTFLILPGRVLLALAYFGINIALMFPRLNFDYHATFLAKRLGW